MMPNPKGNAQKPKQILRPTNPSVQKAEKPDIVMVFIYFTF